MDTYHNLSHKILIIKSLILVRPAGIEPTTFPRRKGALGTLSPKYANRKWRNRHRDELGATGGN